MQQVNQNLSFLERRELLEKYRSDLRKVDFERNYLIALIEQLEMELQIPSTPQYSQPTVQQNTVQQNTVQQNTVQQNIPVKKAAATATATPSKSYTKITSADAKKRQRFYNFKLSDWDVLMLEVLENITEPLNSAALLKIFEDRNAALSKPLDDKQLRNALSRTVHKLANKNDAVLKENFGGKGFLYTLNPNYSA